MISLVSPAKTLNFDPLILRLECSNSLFLEESKILINELKKKSRTQLSKLMGLSDNLSEVNFTRYKEWKTPFKKPLAKPAVFAFQGDVYKGLNITSFSEEDLKYSQKHFRILSGLYGVLRPLDLIMPYRLEMGTKLNNSKGKDLYSFWKTQLTQSLNDDLKKHEDKVILNLASNEYSKVINFKEINAKIITPVFKDWKNGKYKVISFFAKKARGMMASYHLKNKISNFKELKSFSENGYSFDLKKSSESEMIFTRKMT